MEIYNQQKKINRAMFIPVRYYMSTSGRTFYAALGFAGEHIKGESRICYDAAYSDLEKKVKEEYCDFFGEKNSSREPEEVIISKENIGLTINKGTNDYYLCSNPKCSNLDINIYDKYCSQCGKKIIWQK